MTIPLQQADKTDFPAIIALMNAAFRGGDGPRGWSTEADYFTGQRTNESLLSEEFADGALYLLAKDAATSALLGCVRLKAVSPERWYLGSLTIQPALQNTGLGRKLLIAAEEYAAIRGARTIEITVVNVRDTLISWYERRGYRQTGETRPFPYGDLRFGTPTRGDLEFVVLQRHLLE
jgi:ribosomal protein S18 acetylase RimI-like enzyme